MSNRGNWNVFKSRRQAVLMYSAIALFLVASGGVFLATRQPDSRFFSLKKVLLPGLVYSIATEEPSASVTFDASAGTPKAKGGAPTNGNAAKPDTYKYSNTAAGSGVKVSLVDAAKPKQAVTEFSSANGAIRMALLSSKGTVAEMTGLEVTKDGWIPLLSKDKLVMRDVLPSTDIEYRVIENGLKEDIVMKDASAVAGSREGTYAYAIDLKNVTPVTQKDGTMAPWFVYSDTQKYAFNIAEPYMVDAKGEKSANVTAKVRHTTPADPWFDPDRQPVDQMVLVFAPDQEWLKAPGRAFPVRLDPTIVQNTQADFNGGYQDGTATAVTSTTATSGSVDVYTKALLHFDGEAGSLNFVDSATPSRKWTPSATDGTIALSTTSSKFGGASASFASGTNLSTPDSDDWNVNGTTVFTVDFWMNSATVGTTARTIFSQSDAPYSANSRFTCFLNTASKLQCDYILSGTTTSVTDASTITAGTWYHVAVVRYSTSLFIFRDGVQVAQNTFPTMWTNFTGPLFIGQDNGTANFVGYLDEFRWSKGIARWTNTFTKPSAAYAATSNYGVTPVDTVDYSNSSSTKLFIPCDGTVGSRQFTDMASGHSVAAVGAAAITSFGKEAQSCSFDGVQGSYLQVPSAADLEPGSGDFTLDTWVYPTSTSQGAVFGKRANSGTVAGIFINYDSNGYRFYATTNGSTWNFSNGLSFGPIQGLNQWTHLAAVRKGSTLYLFQNGVLTSATAVSGTITASSAPVRIGDDSNSIPFAGYVDNVRYTAAALWTANFVPPASSQQDSATYTSSVLGDGVFLADWTTISWTEHGAATGSGETPLSRTSLVAQWNFNATSGTTATNDAGSGTCGGTPANCNATLVNMITTGQDDSATSGWTNANARWGGGAVMFDGSDDYVNAGTSVPSPGAANYAIAAWVRLPGGLPSSEAVIVGRATANGDPRYTLSWDTTGRFRAYFYNNSFPVDLSSTDVFNDAGWHHVLISLDRTANVASLYVDGQTQGSSFIWSSLTNTSTYPLTIGAHRNSAGVMSNWFKGIIDSVQIYSRTIAADEAASLAQTGNVQVQTRTGQSTDPNDGTWSAWSPIGSEASLLDFNSDKANWSLESGAVASGAAAAVADEANAKMEGAGSMKLLTGQPQADANTIALWHLDETSGTGAYLKNSGTGGSAYDATPTGTTTASGKVGQGRLSTINEAIIASGLNWTPTSFTMDWWLYPTACSDYNQVLSSAGGWGGFGFHTDSTCAAYAGVGLATRFTPTELPAGTLTLNTWQHFAYTYNSATSQGTFYKNGVLIAGPKTQNAPTAWTGGLTMGTTSGGGDVGVIDEVRVSNVNRDASWINEQYRLGRDQRFMRTISSTDLTGRTLLPFWVAGDRLGLSAELSFGNNAFQNGDVDDNTIGLWHLEEAAGTGAYLKDSSASGLNMTPTGTSQAAGAIGKARSFSGTSEYADTSSVPTAAVDNWTLDAWVNPSSINQAGVIMINGTSSNGYGLVISNGSSGTGAKLVGNISNVAIVDSGYTFPAANSWYHVAMVRSSGTTSFYVNGVKTPNSSAAVPYTPTTGFSLGHALNYAGSYFAGSIDEARISNVARSAADIRGAYERGARAHNVDIKFAAKLGAAVASSATTSITVDATLKGLAQRATNLNPGDAIIVKENVGGIEYVAQATVAAVISVANGTLSVYSWTGTFPTGGFTTGADVMKWQREWWDISNVNVGAGSSDLFNLKNAVTNLTVRTLNGSTGQTLYLDDLRQSSSYLNTSPAAITSDDGKYLQYRIVETGLGLPSVEAVSVSYGTGYCATSGNNVTLADGCAFSSGTYNYTGTLTIPAGATVYTNQQVILNADAIDVEGTITGTGTGSAAGAGTGAGTTTGKGGTYGGSGVSATLSPYGSITAPTDLGSGGFATAGGGAIKLAAASGTVTVNGTINANGLDSAGATGTGSGGSVWIVAGTLAGTGTVTANGGAASAANGGGGRIAVTGYTGTMPWTLSAYGGGNAATPGTVYTQASSTNGTLTVSNGAGTTGLTTSLPASASVTVDTLNISTASSIFSVPTGTSLTVVSAMIGSTTTPNATLSVAGTLTLGGTQTWTRLNVTVGTSGTTGTLVGTANVTIPSGSTLTSQSTNTMNFGSLIVASGGTVTTPVNQTAQQYEVDIAATGDINVQGAISQDGKGYTAGYKGSCQYGTHGGPQGIMTSASCDSETNPTMIGASGAAGSGVGGGYLRLVSGGTLTVGANISANGAAGVGSYGGAGGTIILDAATLAGTASVSANGNDNTYAGGGGRVVVKYNHLAASNFVGTMATGGAPVSTLKASGGISTSPSNYYGGAGTVLIRNKLTKAVGYLYLTGQSVSTPVNNTFSPETTEVDANLAPDGLFIGANAVYAMTGSVTRTMDFLTVAGYGKLTTVANTTTRANVIDIAATNATVGVYGYIDVTGRGYQYLQGPGAATASRAASHGGLGYNATGNTYDTITGPTDMGSGGSVVALPGGGAIKLNVSGTLTMDSNYSYLKADATHATSTTTSLYGGSGGSIWISAGTLAGFPSTNVNAVSAIGGTNDSTTTQNIGAGGRIAITYGTSAVDFSALTGATMPQTGGGRYFVNPTTAKNCSGQGTVYYRNQNETYGTLAIVGSGQACSNVPQPHTISAATTYKNLRLVNYYASAVIAANVTLTGGLQTNDTSVSYNNALTVNAGSTLNIAGAINAGDLASVANNGTVTVNGGVSIGRMTTFTNAGTFNWSGTWSQNSSGNSTLNFTNTGTLAGIGTADFTYVSGTFNFTQNGVMSNIRNLTAATNAFSSNLCTMTTTGSGGINLTGNLNLTDYTKFDYRNTGAINVGGDLSTVYASTNAFTTTVSPLTVNVTGNMSIGGGAVISVDGLGTNPNTQGGNASASSGYIVGGGGGGNASAGGDGKYTGTLDRTGHGGAANMMDLTYPQQAGGAGGIGYNSTTSYAGANGGGAIALTVGKTLTMGGILSANGSGSAYSGAGAGGSILIQAATIAGSGTMRANGGASTSYGGGGSGGRIAIYYTADGIGLSSVVNSRLNTTYGTSTNGNPGRSGTVYLYRNGDAGGDLIVTNAPALSTCNETTTYTGTPQTKTNLTLKSLYMYGGGAFNVPSGSTLNLIGTGDVALGDGNVMGGSTACLINNGTIDASTRTSLTLATIKVSQKGTFKAPGTFTSYFANFTNAGPFLGAGTYFMVDGGTFDAQTAPASVAGSVVLHEGATYLHSGTSTWTFSSLQINPGSYLKQRPGPADGATVYSIDLALNSANIYGTISASGSGYLTGFGPGAGGNGANATTGSAGGSFGGVGGKTSPLAALPSDTYGTATDAGYNGSGGGLATGLSPILGAAYTSPNGFYYGSGGGLIRITASGPVYVWGSIVADGAAAGNANNGGGSGGGIVIQSSAITGPGTIYARGGANVGSAKSGCGAGGRIYLSDPANAAGFAGAKSAAAATGTYCTADLAASAGTVNYGITPTQPTVTAISHSPANTATSPYANQAVTLSSSATDVIADPISQIQLYVDGRDSAHLVSTCSFAPATIAATCGGTVPAFTLTPGSHAYYARVTDNNGMVGEATDTITVASTAPVVTSVTHTPTTAYTGLDTWLAATAASADGLPVTRLDLSIDGGTAQSCNTNGTPATCSLNFGRLLPGSHTTTVTAFKAADGLASSGTQTFTVAASVPATPTLAVANAYSGQDAVATYSAADTTSVNGLAHLEFYVDGTLVPDATINYTGVQQSASGTANLGRFAVGSHTAYVKAYDADAYGDEAVSVTTSFTVGQSVPTVNSVSVAAPQYNGLDTMMAYNVSDTTSDGVDTIEFYLDDSYLPTTSLTFAPATAATSGLVDLGRLDLGAHSVYLVAYDSDPSGLSVQSSTVNFTVTQSAPTITVTLPTITGGNVLAGDGLVVNYAASDATSDGLTKLEFYKDDVLVYTYQPGGTFASRSGTYNFGLFASHEASPNVSVIAYGSAGGVTSVLNRAVTIVEVAPTITRTRTLNVGSAPAGGDIYDGQTFNYVAHALDADLQGVASIDLYVDATLAGTRLRQCLFTPATTATADCAVTVGPFTSRPGSHYVYIVAKDAFNNVSVMTDTFTSVTAAPAFTVFTPSVTSGSSVGLNAAVGVTATAADADYEGISRVEWVVDSATVAGATCTFGTPATPAECNLATAAYAVGSHSAHAVAYDVDGSATASGSFNWTVTHVGVALTGNASAPSAPKWYSSNSFSVSADGTGDAIGIDHVDLWVDSNLVHSCPLSGTMTGSCSWTVGTLAAGAHSWQFKAYDMQEMMTSTTTANFTVARTAPTVSSNTQTPSGNVSNLQSVTYAAAFVDPDGYGLSKVEWYKDGALAYSCTYSPATTPGACSWNAGTLAIGAHTVYALATDADGTTTAASSFTPSVGIAAPTAANLSLVTSTNYTGLNMQVNWSAADASSPNGLSKIEFWLDNGSYSYAVVSAATVNYTGVHQTGSGTASLGKLAAGTYHAYLRAYDSASGGTLDSTAVTFTVTASRPTVNSFSVTESLYAGQTVTASYSVTDNTSAAGLQKLEFYQDNNDGNYLLKQTVSVGAAGTTTGSVSIGQPTAGYHNVYLLAYDGDATGTTTQSSVQTLYASAPTPVVSKTARTKTGSTPSNNAGDIYTGRTFTYSFHVTTPTNIKTRRVDVYLDATSGTAAYSCDYGAGGSLNPTCTGKVGPFDGETAYHQVYAVATDLSGNSGGSATDYFTAVHADPVIAANVTQYDQNHFINRSGYNYIPSFTEAETVPLKLTGQDATDNEGISYVLYSVDGGTQAVACSYNYAVDPSSTAISCNASVGPFAPGSHTMSVYAYDFGGGVSNTRTQSFTVTASPDPLPPTVTFTRTPSDSQVGLGRTVALSANVHDRNSRNIRQVNWYIDGAAAPSCDYGSGSSATVNCATTSSTYAAGQHTAYVTVLDSASSTWTSQTITWTTVHSGAAISANVHTPSSAKSTDENTFTATANDNVDQIGVDYTDLYVDSAWVHTCSHYGALIGTCEFNAGILASGTHTWQFRTFDTAGQETDTAVTSFYVAQPAAPTWAALSHPPVSALGYNEAATFGATANSPAGITDIVWTVDGNTSYSACSFSPALATASCSLAPATYEVGTHVFAVTAYSANGTETTYTFSTVQVYHYGVSITSIQRSPSNPSTDDSVVLSASVNDNLDKLGIADVQLIIDGATTYTCTLGDGSLTADCSNDFGPLAAGSHTWQVVAHDDAGKATSSSGSSAFTVYAVPPPAPTWSSVSRWPTSASISIGTPVELYGTASADAGLDAVTWYVDGAVVGTCTYSPAVTSAECAAPTAAYGDGNHAAYAVAHSANGTTTNSTSLNWTTSHIGVLLSGGTANPSSPTSADPVTFAITLYDAADGVGIDRAVLVLDGVPAYTCSYDGAVLSESCSAPVEALAAGTHTWLFQAYDALGKETSIATQTLTVAPASGVGTGNPVAITLHSVSPSPTYAGDAVTASFTAGGQQVMLMQIYDGAASGTPVKTCDFSATPGYPKTCSISYAADAVLGAHTFNYVAVGVDESVATASDSVTLTPASPVIGSHSVSRASVPQTDPVTATFHATTADHEGIARMTVAVDGTVVKTCSFSFGTASATCTSDAALYSVGSHQVAYVAYKPDLTTTATAADSFAVIPTAINIASHGMSPEGAIAGDAVTFSFTTANQEATSMEIWLDATVSGSPVQTCTFTPATLPATCAKGFAADAYRGTHGVYYKAYGADGSTAWASDSIDVPISPPVITAHGSNGSSFFHTVPATISFTATSADHEGIARMTISVDGSVVKTCNFALGSSPATCVDSRLYAVGSHAVAYAAYKTDLVQAATATDSFEVIQTAPVFTAAGFSPSPLSIVDPAIFSATASDLDGDGISSIDIFLDAATVSGTPTATCTFIPAVATGATCSDYYGRVPRGSHVLTFKAHDVDGSVTTQVVSFKSAAETLQNKLVLSRLSTNSTATADLYFSLQGDDDGPITVTFPAGFRVSGAADPAQSASPNDCLSGFTSDDTHLYAMKTNCAGGQIILRGATVINPPNPGEYTITWTNDNGRATVMIVGDDQIHINTQVDPYMAFNVGVQEAAEECTTGFDGSGGTVDLGRLGPSYVRGSDLDGVRHICTRLTSNATNGAVVTVRSLNGGLRSQAALGDLIPSTTGGVSPGLPNYGLCASSVTGETGNGSPYTPGASAPAMAAPFSGSCSAADHSAVGGLTATDQPLWSVAGTTVDAFAKLYVKASVSATTPAHQDYFDELTFIATSTF